MKRIIQLEEVLMFVLGIYLFSLLEYQWYWFLILLLTPDIGMLGYLFGNKIGAAVYNIFHHKGLAILLYIIGVYLNMQVVQLVGIILFSHSAMDRAMGYGLKYDKGFKFTHFGGNRQEGWIMHWMYFWDFCWELYSCIGSSHYFAKKRKKELTEQQSTVLLDKIRSVAKLVSVEGDFAEIYHYENTKESFMSLFSSKKKALIVIKAKAQVGYDLKRLDLSADTNKKKIILKNFPEPEVLSIEPDLQFYDIKNGLFNSFSPKDMTQLNAEAKEHIKQKIPESGLMESAKKEALQAVLLVEKIVETIGWTLDYSALEITDLDQKFLDS